MSHVKQSEDAVRTDQVTEEVSAPPRFVLERVIEPSRIRRWRLATSPTWYVRDTAWGDRTRFPRKLDAQRFINNGGCNFVRPDEEEHPRFGCPICFGSTVERGKKGQVA